MQEELQPVHILYGWSSIFSKKILFYKFLKTMSESVENRPKRRRISTAKPIPAGSSNQKKVTEKVILPEKKPVVFIKERHEQPVNEVAATPAVQEEVVMMANPIAPA